MQQQILQAVHRAQNAAQKPTYMFFEKTYFTTPSIEQLTERGFVLKRGYTTAWTEEEDMLVVEFFKEFLTNQITMHDPDPYRYVSRNILKGSKTREEVWTHCIQMYKDAKAKK